MKAFHFTLEAVGTVRQRQEQKAMEQYAQSLIVRRRALEKLEAAEWELSACWQEWRGRLAGGYTAAEAAQAHAYQRSLAQIRDECAQALATAERRVNATLQAMLVARKEREVVDKCFDKQKARHQRELARGEQKFLDDLAGRRGNSILAWKSAETPL
ncbi:MAG: flagellar export protein FliJ [Limisphaerales bacterium]